MKKLLLLIPLLLLLYSCNKSTEKVASSFNFEVPANFDWDSIITHEEVNNKSDYIHHYGSLWFEDTYPYFGDMDMNDIVANYSITHYKYGSYKINETVIDLHVEACGSTTKLGIGFIFETLKLKDFTAIMVKKNGIEIPANNIFFTTSNKNNYEEYMVVDLSYDVHQDIGYETPICVNTYKKHTDGVDYTIFIKYSPINTISDKGIDFFIFKDEIEGYRTEIHTFSNYPTEMALNNNANFHNPQQVWGLRMDIQNIPYAKEVVNIFDAYPQFKEYVRSNKKQNKYWYYYPIKDSVINY